MKPTTVENNCVKDSKNVSKQASPKSKKLKLIQTCIYICLNENSKEQKEQKIIQKKKKKKQKCEFSVFYFLKQLVTTRSNIRTSTWQFIIVAV